MRHLLPVLLICVAGCTSFDTMEKNWPKLKGQPISAAVERFGYPASEQTMLGAKVYTWSTATSHVALAPTVGTAYGTIGNAPVSATAAGFVPVSSNLACTVKIITGPDDIIKQMQYDGNNGACDQYAQAMAK